ncbi:Peptidase S24 [Pseudodesulfovibrio profundus]|uniref:Peptidase S24 n=1 Tax=Pseudodesulfovibrio profundus TaxID=57320 RepID=A0A2C8FEX0_9BACT|nr:LexA family transcriptional regulator [Pseudodesulfovibrio profundus]SOB60609.1 Peptidase S24 [Pseudodesulfovibrio profundus]
MLSLMSNLFGKRLKEWAEGHGLNQKRLAEMVGIDPSQVSKLYNGKHVRSDTMLKLLDGVGAKIVMPGADENMPTKDVCFVDAQTVNAAHANGLAAADYMAVPLAQEAVAAGPGLIPEDSVEGWIMVWKGHESVGLKRNLIAVKIGKGQDSMEPTFHPGDILLIDKSDRDPMASPAKTWLVCEPDGACAIKRVNVQKRDGDHEFIFYSDNKMYPPTSYWLGRDYSGDINRAIGGRVVWAWSDVRNK